MWLWLRLFSCGELGPAPIPAGADVWDVALPLMFVGLVTLATDGPPPRPIIGTFQSLSWLSIVDSL